MTMLKRMGRRFCHLTSLRRQRRAGRPWAPRANTALAVSSHIVPTAPDRSLKRENIDVLEGPASTARTASSDRSRKVVEEEGDDGGEDNDADARRWRFEDAQLLIALSQLHEARARIDKLEHAVADAATHSERACEKLAYIASAADHPHGHKGRFEKGAKLVVVERNEANELVKNVCAMLKGVVQPVPG